MQYGICLLSIVPLRSQAEETAEMVSQILYGEHYKILEQRRHWSKIRTAFDNCEGWVQNLQIIFLKEEQYKELDSDSSPDYSTDLVSFVEMDKNNLLPIVLGSVFHETSKHLHEGNLISSTQEKSNFINTALLYLNTPHLWVEKHHLVLMLLDSHKWYIG